MTQKEKSLLKKEIKEKISQSEKQIHTLEARAKPITPDCSLGRLTRLEAMGEQDINHKVLDESRITLTRLKNALQRIDSPMFGICIACEEEIGFARMSIRPESVRCVVCANTM